MVEDVLRWPTMSGTYLEVIGCLGVALVGLLGGVILKINAFRLNACLLSKIFQIGKVQTKAETIERYMRCQGSSSKRLCLELLGCTVRLKEV